MDSVEPEVLPALPTLTAAPVTWVGAHLREHPQMENIFLGKTLLSLAFLSVTVEELTLRPADEWQGGTQSERRRESLRPDRTLFKDTKSQARKVTPVACWARVVFTCPGRSQPPAPRCAQRREAFACRSLSSPYDSYPVCGMRIFLRHTARSSRSHFRKGLKSSRM